MTWYQSTMIWVSGHPVWVSLIVLSIGLVALNAIAYQHACAMLWFTDAGERTPRPQDLSLPRKIAVLLTGIRVPRPENDRTPESISLAFQAIRIPVDDCVELEAWSIPAAHARGTMILFHGYASMKSNLLAEANAFHELGYDVWLVDFRGSGGSTERYTTVGVREADDVAAVVKYVRRSSMIGPLILYGNSMGAAAILRSITKCGVAADGVILISIFDRLLSTARNRFHQMGLPGFPGANLLLFWGGISAGFSGFRHNPVEDGAG